MEQSQRNASLRGNKLSIFNFHSTASQPDFVQVTSRKDPDMKLGPGRIRHWILFSVTYTMLHISITFHLQDKSSLLQGIYTLVPGLFRLYLCLSLSILQFHFTIIFIGVNLTFFPQHSFGLSSMPQ